MRAYLSVCCCILLPLLASGAPVKKSAVLRPAPSFSWMGPGNKVQSLKSIRGQSVVLVIAESANARTARKQFRFLEEVYQQFASKQVVFAIALKEGSGPVRSDIPFVIVNDGPSTAAAYGGNERFQIAIIGRDGNIDYQTTKVLTGERVRDVIQNSFAVQAVARK